MIGRKCRRCARGSAHTAVTGEHLPVKAFCLISPRSCKVAASLHFPSRCESPLSALPCRLCMVRLWSELLHHSGSGTDLSFQQMPINSFASGSQCSRHIFVPCRLSERWNQEETNLPTFPISSRLFSHHSICRKLCAGLLCVFAGWKVAGIDWVCVLGFMRLPEFFFICFCSPKTDSLSPSTRQEDGIANLLPPPPQVTVGLI